MSVCKRSGKGLCLNTYANAADGRAARAGDRVIGAGAGGHGCRGRSGAGRLRDARRGRWRRRLILFFGVCRLVSRGRRLELCNIGRGLGHCRAGNGWPGSGGFFLIDHVLVCRRNRGKRDRRRRRRWRRDGLFDAESRRRRVVRRCGVSRIHRRGSDACNAFHKNSFLNNIGRVTMRCWA